MSPSQGSWEVEDIILMWQMRKLRELDVNVIRVTQLGSHRAETWFLIFPTLRTLLYTIWKSSKRGKALVKRITASLGEGLWVRWLWLLCSQPNLSKQPWKWEQWMSSREVSDQSTLLQPPVLKSRRGKKNVRDDFETPAERHYHHPLLSQAQGSERKEWSWLRTVGEVKKLKTDFYFSHFNYLSLCPPVNSTSCRILWNIKLRLQSWVVERILC